MIDRSHPDLRLMLKRNPNASDALCAAMLRVKAAERAVRDADGAIEDFRASIFSGGRTTATDEENAHGESLVAAAAAAEAELDAARKQLAVTV